MAEGAVEASKPRGGPGEALLQGRIGFHPARRPFSVAAIAGGDLRVEALNPSSGSRRAGAASVAAAASSSAVLGRKSDGGQLLQQRGLDPELRFEITFRRIGAGLANLGNTCFLNSVLQCLTYTEPFAAYLQSGKHKSSCRTTGFCALCALQSHVMDALRSTGKILRPFHLVKNLRCVSRNFRNSRQEDAHEYMVNLLESMHKCCLPSGIASESPNAYEKSLVHKIFGGRLRSQVKCLQCSYCSNKFDPFLDLSLEIVKADTLHKALSNFTAVEQLDGGEKQYQCQQCKQKVRAVKQLTIHKAPYVLTVHLKRFDSALPGQKINKKVDFEPTLDLKRHVSDPCEGDLKYTLYGVLVHAGYATHSGHYYCFVRTSSGMWYSLNDDEVFQVSEKTVLQQKAYMLFYVRNIRSSASNRALDVVSKEKSLANASGSNNLPVNSLDSTKASQDCPGKSEPKKAIQECARESGPKQYNAIPKTGNSSHDVPIPVKDISVEQHLLKKTSISPCRLAEDIQETAFLSLSKVSSIKEPTATISLLSSARGEHLISEGLTVGASSRDNCNKLCRKDLVQSSLSKEVSDCSVASGLIQSASASDNIVATNSIIEDCTVAPVCTQTSHMDVDKSNIHAMCHAKGNAILNPDPEKVLQGTVPQNNGAQNSKVQDGTSCKVQRLLEHERPTTLKHSSAPGVPADLIVAQVQYQGAIVKGRKSNGTVTANFLENISKESMQVILINSTLCCSQKKEAVGHTEFDKLVMKQKVRKHSHLRNVNFGPRRLFLASLNLVKRNMKKKKHRRMKKRCLNIKFNKRYGTSEDTIQGDQGTSTSRKVDVVDVGLVHSTKKSCKSLHRENGAAIDADVVLSTKKNCCNNSGRDNGLCGMGGVNIINNSSVSVKVSDCGRRYVNNSSESSLKLEGQHSTGGACTCSNSHHHVSRNLSMSNSGEVTVVRGDDIDSLPEVASIRDDEPKSIGYMLDEWGKEYDRGKKKKVKKSRKFFGGGNHFRDIAAVRAQKKMKMDQTSSGSMPFRING